MATLPSKICNFAQIWQSTFLFCFIINFLKILESLLRIALVRILSFIRLKLFPPLRSYGHQVCTAGELLQSNPGLAFSWYQWCHRHAVKINFEKYSCTQFLRGLCLMVTQKYLLKTTWQRCHQNLRKKVSQTPSQSKRPWYLLSKFGGCSSSRRRIFLYKPFNTI